MSDIYVVIRNQTGTAMSSIEGESLIVLLAIEEIVYRQASISLRVAAAFFLNLPRGLYSVIVRHPVLNPAEARQEVDLPEHAAFGVRFIYDEPIRQLLGIETEMRLLDG